MASAPSSAAIERKQRLEHIQNLRLDASNMDNALYDENKLKTLNVSIEPLTLTQTGMPTFSPCFFQPFGGDIKEDPYVEELDDDSKKWEPYEAFQFESKVSAVLTFRNTRRDRKFPKLNLEPDGYSWVCIVRSVLSSFGHIAFHSISFSGGLASFVSNDMASFPERRLGVG